MHKIKSSVKIGLTGKHVQLNFYIYNHTNGYGFCAVEH